MAGFTTKPNIKTDCCVCIEGEIERFMKRPRLDIAMTSLALLMRWTAAGASKSGAGARTLRMSRRTTCAAFTTTTHSRRHPKSLLQLSDSIPSTALGATKLPPSLAVSRQISYQTNNVANSFRRNTSNGGALHSELRSITHRNGITELGMAKRRQSTAASASAVAAEDQTKQEVVELSQNQTEAVSEATDAETMLYDPEKLGPLKMPSGLSPSSIMEFQKCPQSYLFQYLYSLRQPQNLALAKGTMCHSALEQIYDLEPHERTLENLQNLFRMNWGQKRTTDVYRFLFETNETITSEDEQGNIVEEPVRDIDAEREWGLAAMKLLENYVNFEDPKTIVRPNPMRREVWAVAKLTVDPALGATAPQSSEDGNGNNIAEEQDTGNVENYDIDGAEEDVKSENETDVEQTEPEQFLVRGIVDRLDLIRNGPGQGVGLRIVDYKTGKAPHLKYTPAVNHRIVQENIFQLKIYALLLREKKNKYTKNNKRSIDHRYLRLLYLTSHQGKAESIDYDLGADEHEREAELNAVHAELSNVWTSIQKLVEQQDPKAFVGCDRSFCYCHKCRPRFLPGTVWEPPPDLRRR